MHLSLLTWNVLAVLQQTSVTSLDILGFVMKKVVVDRFHVNLLDLLLVHLFIFRVSASFLSVGHTEDFLRSCRGIVSEKLRPSTVSGRGSCSGWYEGVRSREMFRWLRRREARMLNVTDDGC